MFKTEKDKLKIERNKYKAKKSDRSTEDTLVIVGELPTLNEIISAQNTQNRRIYAKMKRENTELVRYCAVGINPVKSADFDITFYCKNKTKDKDGILSGGIKFIFDGLVEAGIIENDGWGQVNNITPRFEIDKKDPRIVVKLKNIEKRGE